MDTRRYADDEVASIFREAATESESPRPIVTGAQDGLTLAEIQKIATEVGLSSDAVAHAAATLDARRGAADRHWFGFRVGVARTVELGRKLTDDEWDRLVVQLRDTFEATGRIRIEGGLRQWSNGNLHVRLEPTASGQRLHLSTLDGPALKYLRGGLTASSFGVILLLVSAITGNVDVFLPGLIAGLAGVTSMLVGALRLPRWSRLRGRQMEAIAADVQEVSGESVAPVAK